MIVPARAAETPGRTATPAEIAGWDIDIAPDGAGLPAGSGSAHDGATLFATKCAACHGEHGAASDKAPAPPLVGGQDTLASAHPQRTVGSYWPYATTLFDYIRRAMPFDAPQSLPPDQVYALCAFILARNGIVADDAVLNRDTLARVQMPNRNGFHDQVPEPR